MLANKGELISMIVASRKHVFFSPQAFQVPLARLYSRVPGTPSQIQAIFGPCGEKKKTCFFVHFLLNFAKVI